MPNLTVNNRTLAPMPFQDPTGLTQLSFTVPEGTMVGSPIPSLVPGTLTIYVTEDQLAALQPLLDAEQTAGHLTWSAVGTTADREIVQARYQLPAFFAAAPAAGASAYMTVAGSTLLEQRTIFSGRLVGMSLRADVAPTGDTITATVRVEGSPTAMQVVLTPPAFKGFDTAHPVGVGADQAVEVFLASGASLSNGPNLLAILEFEE